MCRRQIQNHHGRRQHKATGISDASIRRLARRGGVKRISNLIYEETRTALKEFLKNVVCDAVTYTEYARRKTMTAMDVVHALKRQGHTLYGYHGVTSYNQQNVCSNCNARNSQRCHLGFCEHCEKHFCEKCRYLEYCDSCNNEYCGTCRQFYICDVCDKAYCHICF